MSKRDLAAAVAAEGAHSVDLCRLSATFIMEKWSKTSKFGCDRHGALVDLRVTRALRRAHDI